ncbi:kynureninase-like isoform X2 [Dysidea avara]
MYGNGLGLQPVDTQRLVNEELYKWKTKGMLAHFTGEQPWFTIEDLVIKESGALVGSHDPTLEVAIMNGVTANLHLGMVAFYRPTTTRHKILIECDAFPTQHYVAESQIKLHGYNPADSLVVVSPRKDEYTLRTEDILAKINQEGDSIALVLFSGVQYLTGQFFDIAAITETAHSKGCCVGIDLAHAIGNVELHLTDWGVDFAGWCNYKYMNGGPGSIGGFFLHKKYAEEFALPRLAGWWSHKRETRLEMNNKMELQPGAAGFQLSNPPVLETVSLLASLNVFKQTSITELRRKSVLLTGYLELLLNSLFQSKVAVSNCNGTNTQPATVEIITPSDPEQRGCQLSLKLSCPVEEINQKLYQKGVICSTRRPNIMRIAPTPLYNTFTDVLTFVQELEQAIMLVEPPKFDDNLKK